MKQAVFVFIMPFLILDSIMVWGALTEEEMDIIYENADFETGYRCFNWPHCVDSSSCTRISEGKDLAELIETCRNDGECVAVSCEGFTSINGGHCTRSMLSGYCDEYTKDDEDNWQIISGGTYEFVESGTCESNGFRSIQTESECSEAATFFEKSSTDVIYREGNWREGRPTGCSWHNYGNLELWSVSSGDCDVHGYAGCFCLNPLTFGSA